MKIYGVARKGRALIIICFHFKTIVIQIIIEIWKSSAIQQLYYVPTDNLLFFFFN